MIDRIVCAKARDTFSPNYSPSEAITDVRLDNPHAENLAVIFPPWHGGGNVIQKLSQRLKTNRWAVLTFEFHDQILEPDVDRVPKSYDSIRRYASADIKSVQHEYGYDKTRLIGISLGTLAMSVVAETAEFSSADFVIPCSRLAPAMWEGARTQGIRSDFESQGFSKEELAESWRKLEPQAYAQYFKDKDIYSVMSSKDKIIPFEFQDEMMARLLAEGARIHERYSRLGHAATIVKHSFKGKI
jgi:hypothetical protein